MTRPLSALDRKKYSAIFITELHKTLKSNKNIKEIKTDTIKEIRVSMFMLETRHILFTVEEKGCASNYRICHNDKRE